MTNDGALIVVDVETSGPSCFEHQILSVSFVPFYDVHPPLTVYIRHDEIKWGNTAKSYFEQYREEWEKGAISVKGAYKEIDAYFGGFPANRITLAGHNVGFDYAFLQQLLHLNGKERFNKVGYRLVDTHSIFYYLQALECAECDPITLDSMLNKFNIKVDEKDRHKSLVDAMVTRKLLMRLMNIHA